MHGKVDALGEVITQPVGILVRWSLPGRMRIAEIDAHPQGGGDLKVASHLASLIPRQRSAQPGGQGAHRGHDPRPGSLRGVVIWQVNEEYGPAGPFDQGPDR